MRVKVYVLVEGENHSFHARSWRVCGGLAEFFGVYGYDVCTDCRDEYRAVPLHAIISIVPAEKPVPSQKG